jgi:pyruvyltransferase
MNKFLFTQLLRSIEKLKRRIKKDFYRIYYESERILHPDSYMVHWDSILNNFGDIITPFILEHLTKKKIIRISYPRFCFGAHYFVVGSILDRATKDTIVWGSGFISNNDKCCEKPKEIRSVRGPLTRNELLCQGIDCPEVYGDPALLLPLYYFPKIHKKYKIGIIPHYADKNNSWITKLKNNQDIKIIDIQVNSPINLINEVLQCESIASSSLHGIIVADAYNIPSIWVEFSNKVYGNGFKFIDYFMSVGRTDRKPIHIVEDTSVMELLQNIQSYKININLMKLVECSPFH